MVLSPPRTVPDGDTMGCCFSQVWSPGMLRERETVNNNTAFSLLQSIQDPSPSPWSGWALCTNNSYAVGRHIPTAKVTRSILVGPTIMLHFLMWYPNSIWLFLVPSDVAGVVSMVIICLQIPQIVSCPLVPCKCLLSITWPLRSPCPGSLLLPVIFSSLPVVVRFSSAGFPSGFSADLFGPPLFLP